MLPAGPSLRTRARHATARRAVLTLLAITALQITSAAQEPDAGPARAAHVCAATDGVMPPNVTVGEPFPSLMRHMLMYSPTFRAQCQRIAAEGRLRVVMRLDMGWRRRDRTAHAVFQFAAGGEIHATLEFGLSTNYAPIVAHEFEHVLEQLDRLDLPEMAKTRGDVHEIEPGVYETDRADHVEGIVERELFGRRRSTHAGTPVVPREAPAPTEPPTRHGSR